MQHKHKHKWNYADLMTKPLARLEFKRLRDLCLRPESGVTGHPSVELGDSSMDDEVANFFNHRYKSGECQNSGFKTRNYVDLYCERCGDCTHSE